jgi:pyruvate formate lyase activating enzyme
MIEIKGFLEASFVDWPGKISAVLFLPGCNFRCPFCHNHPLLFHPEQYASIPLEAVLERLDDFLGWVDGICLTGGEPTLHRDLPALIRAVRDRGFAVKLDTNGSQPDLLERLIGDGAVDCIHMDVKAPLDPFSYRRATGTSVDLDLINRSIALLKAGAVEYAFRMTVVPTLHRLEDVSLLAGQLEAGERFLLQNFNPENPLDPSLRTVVPYDPEVLRALQAEVRVQGLAREGQASMTRG